jgi:hypothetical protein
MDEKDLLVNKRLNFEPSRSFSVFDRFNLPDG